MIALFIELVKKDLLSFAADRRAMIMAFLVPIGIASFLGSIMGSSGGSSSIKVPLLVVDEDHSSVSRQIVDRLHATRSLEVRDADLARAKREVSNGSNGTALLLAKGFGEKASAAMAGGVDKPELTFITDPSKGMETQAARGMVIQATVQGIAGSTFGQDSLPFNVVEQPQAGTPDTKWSGSAHAFAGMGVQSLFFGAVEAAMGMIRDRRNGVWARLRASAVSPWTLLAARFLGSAIISFFVFLGVLGFGALAFGYRVTGSYLGFFLIVAATAAMAAGVGMFIAALGRTEQQSRSLAILVILGMLMLGGAWVPSFIMPKFIQSISFLTPVRWAVDGLDSMTFRGLPLSTALPSVGVLLLFAVVLILVAGKRFRWEPEGA